MTERSAALAGALGTSPVIGILRRFRMEDAVEVGARAVESGVRCIEVTFDSDDPLTQIERVSSAVAGNGGLVGAGTVMSRSDVEAAVDHGAQFILSPGLVPEVVEACVEHDVPCLPGVATPTEAIRAVDLGAFAVKVYPASHLGGHEYIRDLAVPLADMRFVPTGGIDAGNVRAYLDAGSFAVGVGSSVFRASASDPDELVGNIDSLMAAIGQTDRVA